MQLLHFLLLNQLRDSALIALHALTRANHAVLTAVAIRAHSMAMQLFDLLPSIAEVHLFTIQGQVHLQEPRMAPRALTEPDLA